MIFKDIDQITEEDLRTLIANSVIEKKNLEYKQELPGNTDSEKKEFLADISSFANASGGDIIYGMIENRNTGLPTALKGVAIENIDQEIIRLDNIIRDGIGPRISGTRTRHIKLSNGNLALIIRIPKSWISPHRVVFGGHDKFYARSTNGKYSMDVSELRIAFNLSESVVERIRKFREDRISKILAGETPILLHEGAKICLHLIPIISFSPAQRYELSKDASGKLSPMYCRGWNNRYNFDGYLNHSPVVDGKVYSYTQFFKNGIIEAVEAASLDPRHKDGKLLIPRIAYEKELIEVLSNCLSVFKLLNIELPIFLLLALLGVKGYSMGIDMWDLFKDQLDTIDRDILVLPEILIENYGIASKDILRPCFDSIWNACGFPKSLNYNDAGEWVGK